ncbi:MAG: MFS transporter [Spirochaetaceae bacterium]|nr:MAG: MFS transporter [Spirochaetaceae bacterium]
MTPSERKILFFTCSAHTLTHIYMLIFPALVMPVGRGLGLSLSRVVSMSFWSYLLYGILAAPWGALCDRIGHKWALCSGLVISGFGLILAGTFPNPGSIVISFALVGIGSAAYHPSAVSLLSQSIRERGRAMGINGMWGNIGMAIVPFTVGLLNFVIGWQKGLILLGSLGLALGIVGVFMHFGVQRGEDQKVVEPIARGAANRLLVIFGIGLIFSGLMYRSYTVILPAFLEYRLGDMTEVFRRWVIDRLVDVRDAPAFNTLVANLVATVIYVVGAIGQGIGGRIADRYSLKWLYFSFYALALPFVAATIWIANAWLMPAVGIFMLFALGALPIENSLVAYLTPARWRSIIYGVKYTLIFGVGSFAVKLVGWVQEYYGLQSVMLLIVFFNICFLVVIGLFLITSRGYAFRH